MEVLHSILSQGLMITGFVLIMMMVIEYLNVLTHGRWDSVIEKWTTSQSVFCSFLGATPGCLGAYAAGSLYIHRVIGIGALTAAMFATCGDESFVMLALFPKTAIKIFAALFVGGIITGVVIDFFHGRQQTAIPVGKLHQTSHPGNPVCIPFSTKAFVSQWRNCTPHRGWLTFFLILFLAGIVSGTITHEHHHGIAGDTQSTITAAPEQHHHNQTVTASVADQPSPGEHHESEWNWLRITFLVLSLVALAIVATVPDHFLDEHLWHHLIRIHAWKIFLWTVGALAVTHFLVNSFNIAEIVADHRLPLLLSACLVGLLPVSGPHLIFVYLYFQGAIPLSILLANCIVQDGHGLLPTLSHSRKTFVYIKGIKLIIGFAVGLTLHIMGW